MKSFTIILIAVIAAITFVLFAEWTEIPADSARIVLYDSTGVELWDSVTVAARDTSKIGQVRVTVEYYWENDSVWLERTTIYRWPVDSTRVWGARSGERWRKCKK